MRKTLVTALALLAPLAFSPMEPAAAPATQTVTLAVENMTCAACPIAVRKALQKVPGVTNVKVDLDAKTATVTYDPNRTQVSALTKATTDAGYPSKLVR